MKSLLYRVACWALLVGTLSGGWLHGRSSNRWGIDNALQRAADQLLQPLPTRLGNWRLLAEQPFTAEVVQMLQCPAHICRTYTNDQTGGSINVAVIIGPPGPISVHTPEICYSSEDFQVTKGRVATNLRDRGGQEHSFWELRLQANDVSATPLRVMYGWGTGGVWSASDRPRFAYGGVPYLYKIQVAAAESDENDEYDPCQDFLGMFLTELQSCLISQATSPAGLAQYQPHKFGGR